MDKVTLYLTSKSSITIRLIKRILTPVIDELQIEVVDQKSLTNIRIYYPSNQVLLVDGDIPLADEMIRRFIGIVGGRKYSRVIVFHSGLNQYERVRLKVAGVDAFIPISDLDRDLEPIIHRLIQSKKGPIS